MNPFKSVRPDGIPNCIWRNFVPEYSLPVAETFNASFSACTFPMEWKDSYVTPISRVTPVTADEDLRPIALTPCSAKIQEDFALKCFMTCFIHDMRKVKVLSLPETIKQKST